MALRQQVWIDKSVQGVLTGRVVLYWLTGVMYVVIGAACFQYHQNPSWSITEHLGELFNQLWPWMPTATMLLPLAIYDVVKLSNLFVGPVYRLRKHFQELRSDIACSPLRFREDDYWRDLSAPINDLQAEILRLHTVVVELQQANMALGSENAVLKSHIAEPVEVMLVEGAPTEVAVKTKLPALPSGSSDAPPFEIPASLSGIE